MAGLPEEAYLEEFIPAPPTEEDDEEAPNTEDDMGLGDILIMCAAYTAHAKAWAVGA